MAILERISSAFSGKKGAASKGSEGKDSGPEAREAAEAQSLLKRAESLESRLLQAESRLKSAESDITVLKNNVKCASGLINESVGVSISEKDKLKGIAVMARTNAAALDELSRRVESLDKLVSDPERRDMIIARDPDIEKLKMDFEELKKSVITSADYQSGASKPDKRRRA